MTGRLLDEFRRWLRPTASAVDQAAASQIVEQKAPSAFVIDDDEGICKFVSTVLATLRIENETFTTADTAIAALRHRSPNLIFLDIALKKSDAVDVIRSLGAGRYPGVVQLMSGSDLTLLDDVRRIGERHGL